MTSDVFVGGCLVYFKLESTDPLVFCKNEQRKCKTQFLRGVDVFIVAKAACDSCKFRNNPPHLEPTEIKENTFNVPPVFDTLGFAGSQELEQSLLEENTVPLVYKESRTNADTLTVETASIALPVPPIELKRQQKGKHEKMANKYFTTASRLAPLPPFEPEKQGLGMATIEDVLAQYGSAPSVMGSSKMKTGQHCLRMFYLKFVLGLKKRYDSYKKEDIAEDERVVPVEIGGLFHLVLHLHLATGGRETWTPLYMIKDRNPETVLTVRQLIENYSRTHYAKDAIALDFRGTEIESRYICQPRMIHGTKRALTLSTRHDQLYHVLRRGEARQPVGEPCSSITIGELKTTKSMPFLSMPGLRINVQTTLNLWTARFGHVLMDGTLVEESVEQLFGPVTDIQYDFIAKSKKFVQKRDCKRFRFNVSDEQVAHQFLTLEDFLYEEIADRLFYKNCFDPSVWTQSYWCHDIYYPGWLCPYCTLCDQRSTNFDNVLGFDRVDRDLITPENILWTDKIQPAYKMKKGKLFKPSRGVIGDKQD